jgi:hypothetical protein
VREGISKPSIWEGIQAQVLLGNEEFVEKLKGYVKGYEEIAERISDSSPVRAIPSWQQNNNLLAWLRSL